MDDGWQLGQHLVNLCRGGMSREAEADTGMGFRVILSHGQENM